MTDYLPEWARDDSPTRAMSETEARAWYKAHSAIGDCRFALRPGHGKPGELATVWLALHDDLEQRKSTPADRALIGQLRDAYMLHVQGRPYVVPTFTPSAKSKRKPAKAHPDTEAMNAICRVLSGVEWHPESLDAIAAIVRESGRYIADACDCGAGEGDDHDPDCNIHQRGEKESEAA